MKYSLAAQLYFVIQLKFNLSKSSEVTLLRVQTVNEA